MYEKILGVIYGAYSIIMGGEGDYWEVQRGLRLYYNV